LEAWSRQEVARPRKIATDLMQARSREVQNAQSQAQTAQAQLASAQQQLADFTDLQAKKTAAA